MNIKTIIEFSIKDDIEKIICDWAKKSDFYEYSSSDIQALVDIDNVSYCYCLDQGKARTFLTIHHLDQIVQMEAWITQGIKQDKQSMQGINELLKMLGQKTLQEKQETKGERYEKV
jgi:hypothetical protein